MLGFYGCYNKIVIGHVRKSNKGEIKMKNYFNKIIIMFVMALGIIGFNYTSAFAEDTNKSIKINNKTLNYNKIIYVDAKNGNNTSGDGTIQNPYETFNFAYSKITPENNEAIVLGEGEYEVSVDDSTIKTMDIIGQGRNTSLLFNHGLRRLNNSEEVMYIFNKINFYDLVFKTNIIGSNLFVTENTNFFNVAIAPPNQSMFSFFWNDITEPSSFVNCSDVTNIEMLLRGNFNLTNCYGRFSYGYQTTSSNINYTSSVIVTNPSFDENYRITETKLENTGTEFNSDGTNSNLGVYGGEFAWKSNNVDKQTISLDKTLLYLKESESSKLTATTISVGTQINWSSSDESIATVDVNGKVTGIKEGKCIITATISGTDLKSNCAVTVTNKETTVEPNEPTDSEYIINTANAKGDNTNNASGSVSIKFNGTAETTLSVVKTADVKEVWVGDIFTYTIVVTNTGSKAAKAVVINDSAPNHIDFIVDRVTTTKGKVDESSTSKNIVINVGDIEPSETVTIKIPVNVVA